MMDVLGNILDGNIERVIFQYGTFRNNVLVSNYKNALVLTSLPGLDSLREKACILWATKAQNNPQHTDLFPMNESQANTRFRKKFIEYKCRGSKFYNSVIPAMTRALNHSESFKGLSNLEEYL